MNDLLVKCGYDYLPEINYILRFILGDVFGLSFDIAENDGDCIEITRPSAQPGKRLVLACELFQTPHERWLSHDSLPTLPLRRFDASSEGIDLNCLPDSLPVIYGRFLDNGSLLKTESNTIETGIDIFGSAFFMLTRCEELILEDRDEYGRFPFSAALACRESFHDIPVVNCYIELLWFLMQQLWHDLKRKGRSFRILLSHDVDNPLIYAWQNWRTTLRSLMGDLVKRRSLVTAAKRFAVSTASGLGCFNRQENVPDWLLRLDPAYNLDWIMDTDERFGLQSCFNFITGHSGGRIDGVYSLDWEWIKHLLQEINRRGYEIGLHPSFNSWQDTKAVREEFEILKGKCRQIGVKQPEWGGRQHFLRWSNPETWQAWEDAGLHYDSTLGYPEKPGFRCGICYEYPVFNLKTRQQLKLRERPLVFMDASILDYMGGSLPDMTHEAAKYAGIVQEFNGDFVLLHHNCRLSTAEAKSAYCTILEEITAKKPDPEKPIGS